MTARVLLLAILLCSAALSVTGLDWGLPYEWVADSQIVAADRLVSRRSLAPDFFVNPTVSLYLEMAVVSAVRVVHPGASLPDRTFEARRPLTDPQHPGRAYMFTVYRGVRGLSAALTMLTVFVLFRIAAASCGTESALMAAAALAFAMGPAIYGHLNLPEAATVLLTLVALWRFERVATDGSMRTYVLAGMAAGAACATKYTACALAAPFIAAHAARTGPRLASRDSLANAAATLVSVVATFVALTPCAVLKWRTFENSLIYTLHTGFPDGSPIGAERSWGPNLAILANAMGWPLFVAALLGAGATATTLIARRGAHNRAARTIHVVWIAGYLGLFGLSPHHAMRYVLPVVPSLVLLGAGARPARLRAAGAIAAGGVLLYSAAYTASGVSLLLRDPRYAAGRWIAAHAPAEGVVGLTWDAGMPYVEAPVPVKRFNAVYDETVDDAAFVTRAEALLREERALLVASAMPNAEQDEIDARLLTLLDMMRRDPSPDAYREVARFEVRQPWWLSPQPDEVAPAVTIYSRRAP